MYHTVIYNRKLSFPSLYVVVGVAVAEVSVLHQSLIIEIVDRKMLLLEDRLHYAFVECHGFEKVALLVELSTATCR